MTEKRFTYKEFQDGDFLTFAEAYDNGKRITGKEMVDKLNEQQATIKEYEDFCYNLCMFIIGKDLDDEFREEYGKEYKIITKWKGCGSDE